MLKLSHNCIHLTCLYINAQNSPSQASTVHEPWTSRFQAGFRKGRGTRGQIDNIHCIIAKAKEFQKYIYLCFIDYAKTFDCVDQNKLQKILKEIEIDQTTWPASWETYMQVRKQQLELDMEQQTGSK